MSTPEKSLTALLYEKSTLSNFGTLVGIGFGIYGAVDSAKQWAHLNAKLDEIQKAIEDVKKLVDSVYGEVKETQTMISTAGLQDAIGAMFGTFQDLAKRAAKDPNDKKLAADTAELLDDLKRCDNHLREIHAAFMGQRESLGGKPYMRCFVDVVQLGPNKPRTQSDYFYALSRFESWLAVQRKGLFLLGKLYRHEEPQSPDVLQTLINRDAYETLGDGTQVSRFKLQAEKSAESVRELSAYYQVKDPAPDNPPAFGINTNDPGDLFYLDTNPIVADPGHVVVGLQLYGKGDRLAIKIVQAPFDGVVSQKNPNGTTIENSEMNDNVRELIDKKKVQGLIATYGSDAKKAAGKKEIENRIPDFYVNLPSVEVPNLEVMTGAKLYLRGNWICIGVQAAKLNLDLTAADDSSRHWIDTPPHSGAGREEEHFFTIRGTCKYITTQALIPRPLAPLRGAKFWRDFTGHDHRVNLSVKTGLCDIEEIWRKYDITGGLTRGAFLLVTGYTGKVRLKDSRGHCLDSVGYANDRTDFVWDLVHAGSGKIIFDSASGSLRVHGEDLGGWGNSTTPSRVFEWSPMENGSVLLKCSNGKFLGRSADGGLHADKTSVESAERFQIVAA